MSCKLGEGEENDWKCNEKNVSPTSSSSSWGTAPRTPQPPLAPTPCTSSPGGLGLRRSSFTQGWAFRANGAFYAIFLIKNPQKPRGAVRPRRAPRGSGGARTGQRGGWWLLLAPCAPAGPGHTCQGYGVAVGWLWGPTPRTKGKLGVWGGCVGADGDGTRPAGAQHPSPRPCHHPPAVPLSKGGPPGRGLSVSRWGSPPCRMEGGSLGSSRLLAVPNTTVSTATLKPYSFHLANEPAPVTFPGDAEPITPASGHGTPSLSPPQTRLPPPDPTPRPQRRREFGGALCPAGWAPQKQPHCHPEGTVTYKRQADGLINFLLPRAVISWKRTSPETVNWANYSRFRF